MHFDKIHDWDVTAKQAVGIQRTFAPDIKIKPFKHKVELVAGLDCAFIDNGKKIISCAVVLQYPEMDLVEYTYAVQDVGFPYIPGLLSFREAPCCLAALSKLTHEPDLIFVDGQGIAHPRRLGLASHIGLFVDKPVVGCAKSRLTGKYVEPENEKGAYSNLYGADEEIIGVVLRTRKDVKPMFISVGNRCSLEQAIDFVINCSIKYRLPEPTRLADKMVAKIKKDIANQ